MYFKSGPWLLYINSLRLTPSDILQLILYPLSPEILTSTHAKSDNHHVDTSLFYFYPAVVRL